MMMIEKFVVIDGYELEAHFSDGTPPRTIAYAGDDYNLFEKIVSAAGRDMRIPVEFSDI